MEWKNAIVRARRGFRDERRLYLVSMSSLAIAFVCLGGALMAVANLGAVADRWSESGRLTIYLADDARTQDVTQLRMVLESLDEVRAVEHVTPAAARAVSLTSGSSGPCTNAAFRSTSSAAPVPAACAR